MKRIIGIVILLITLGCNAQNITLKGRYTFYQNGDSIRSFSLPHSKTTFNSEHEKVYEEYFKKLGDSTSDLFFEDYTQSPELIVKGTISKNDTSKYYYTQNCASGKKYIIQGNDTTNRYSILCVNNEVIKVVCTKGYLTSDTLIKISDKEFWKTTLPDNTIEYSMRQFDKNGRILLSQWGMSSMTDSTGNFSRFEYDNKKHIETITSSTIGLEDKYGTVVVNYCDRNWIPIKREVIELNNGVKTLRRFECIRID